ncbi:MAG: copper transporter [Bacillota bacterium]|nr:copper transporter [Bacillota bacterium]
MIIDLKYHIASLVAVFLALGIGILIGTTMIGSDVIMKQQERLVANLQQEFVSLREENRRTAEALAVMQADSAYQQQFNREVLPILIQEKLKERKVALVDLNYRKEHDGLVNVLRLAGAEVESATVVNLNMLKNPETSNRVAVFLGKERETPPERYLPEFARYLARALVTGEASEFADFLEEQGIVKISGTCGEPLQDIVLIGGSNSKEQDYAKSFDLVLVKAWQNYGLRVFGVEDSQVPVSYMRYYQSARLTTVDNIDTIYGQVALVRAMGGYPGHYGIKQTAEAFIPPL